MCDTRNVLGQSRCVLLLLAFCGALCLIKPGLAAEDDDKPVRPSALQSIQATLGNVLRRAVGNAPRQQTMQREVTNAVLQQLRKVAGANNNARAVQRQMAIAAAQQRQALMPADKERREKRMRLYAQAMLAWVDGVCSLDETQRAKLAEEVDKLVSRLSQNVPPADRGGNNALLDTFPVKFTLERGTSDKIDALLRSATITKVLSEPQRDKLASALEERSRFETTAATEFVLNLLDRELFFTQQQREQLRPLVRQQLEGKEKQCFSWYDYSYYLPQTPLSRALTETPLRPLLTDAQRRRLHSLTQSADNSASGHSARYISLNSAESDQWLQQIRDAMPAQAERLQEATAVRVEFYARHFHLSEAETRYLQLAGKGVTDESLIAWRRNALMQAKMYKEQAARFGGNFSFSLSSVLPKAIDTYELWVHALKKVSNTSVDTPAYDRDGEIHLGYVSRLTALFDRELWLTPSQRTQLTVKIRDCLPPTWQNSSLWYMEEMSFYVVPLFKLSKSDIRFLSAAQRDAWDGLRNEFQFNGRYAVVHMKNGGQMHLQLPQ